MEDRFVKYSKLYALIFLLFLSIPVMLGIIIAAFYGVSKLVSSSYIDMAFGLSVITLPPALFSSVCVIFFRRTKKHPVGWVRIMSKILFVAGIAISAYVLVNDMISFFTKFNIDIDAYLCFSLPYMAGNIGVLFLIAIIQAFTSSKEVDWMDRNR